MDGVVPVKETFRRELELFIYFSLPSFFFGHAIQNPSIVRQEYDGGASVPRQGSRIIYLAWHYLHSLPVRGKCSGSTCRRQTCKQSWPTEFPHGVVPVAIHLRLRGRTVDRDYDMSQGGRGYDSLVGGANRALDDALQDHDSVARSIPSGIRHR